MTDFLVYETPGGYVSYTSDPKTELISRPLFGFFGSEEDCIAKIHSYIDENQHQVYTEDVSTIYVIRCLDAAVTETYIGKTNNFQSRKFAHESDSCRNTSRCYTFIRENGGWSNWEMKPLGMYWKDNCVYDIDRLEWYWWRKLGGKLNTAIPGKYAIARDMKKLNVSETELFKQYELLEQRLNHEYEGSESPPKFHLTKNLYDEPRVRYRNALVFISPSNDTPVMTEKNPPVLGTLFKAEHDGETCLGWYTSSTLSLSHQRLRNYTLMYVLLTGVPWTIEKISDTCTKEVFHYLAQYFELNCFRSSGEAFAHFKRKRGLVVNV